MNSVNVQAFMLRLCKANLISLSSLSTENGVTQSLSYEEGNKANTAPTIQGVGGKKAVRVWQDVK